MIQRKSYMPANAMKFHNWFVNLVIYVKGKTVHLKEPEWPDIPSHAVFELDDALNYWTPHYELSVISTEKGVKTARDDARKRVEKVIDNFVKQHLYFPSITNADRDKMSIPIHEETPANNFVVTETVELELVLSLIRQLDVHFWVKGSSSKTKPAGCDGVVIVWGMPDKPPTSILELTSNVMASQTPCTLHFDVGDRGKHVYIAAAWQNAHGLLGPWSDIQFSIVP